MGNKLFQLARDAVLKAEDQLRNAQSPTDIDEAINCVEIAKNNLNSAFANSTGAEREQLMEYQNQLIQTLDEKTIE
ncbi:hypothetical protein CIB95_01295 [Lottiidibacillus patelloidae]|uniref:DUF3813 domain-containing protein n=1 Tax=Lottiidibacillus patelloidae TaxID=2670334 RepID=A0A263BYJ1_9BACI|nr:DUF3813 domain-containing protein [Lottiidibacillus patelloidae]OZM58236.1 hypothetical protein CIB95_01295 [Lottiidibacillus patelloidae]